jgi:hypothetical protein
MREQRSEEICSQENVLIINFMFDYTIDNKNDITDYNGNVIKDLTTSIFSKNSTMVKDYEVIKINDYYQMRPDLVSQNMYDTTKYTEFVLKYSGISNPFTLDKDDVLMIPNETQANGMMSYNNNTESNNNTDGIIAQIRNYYKFVNQEYKSDSTSYDNLANKDIPSGIIDTTKNTDYIVPYISEDGRTAVTIKNGRMYFGEDTGITSANMISANNVTNSVQSIIDKTITELSNSNCIYNGTTLADFVRNNYNNN